MNVKAESKAKALASMRATIALEWAGVQALHKGKYVPALKNISEASKQYMDILVEEEMETCYKELKSYFEVKE